MKKILLSAMLLAAASMTMQAKEITFLVKGEPVSNGATVDWSSYQTYPSANNQTEVFIEPKIFVQTDVDANVNIRSLANYPVQVCIGGQCEADEEILKTDLPFKANEAQNLLLDCSIFFDEGEEIMLPPIEVQLEAWFADDPSTVYSLNVNMGSAAGIEAIALQGNKVKVIGRSLDYNVDGATSLSVYSLSGKTVISRNVVGNGSISLGNLPAGVYMYRLNGKKPVAGKFIVK